MARLVYVVGSGYSGSTLLAFLADAHPRIASVGEATGPVRRDDPGAYPCSCGRPLAACPFWADVGAAMRRRGHEFGPGRWELAFQVGASRALRQLAIQSLRHNRLDALRDAAVLRVPGWGARLRALARRNAAFVESVLEASGKEVLVDATKDPARGRLLLRTPGLDVRIVHLVRDAPGQVCSALGREKASLAGAIRRWKRMVGHAARLQALVPAGRFLEMRYEDLCRAPDTEMARLARFAGLAPAPLPPDFRAGDHHIIGNRMRMGATGAIALDERWRERLTPAQIDTILRRTADARRRLGYA